MTEKRFTNHITKTDADGTIHTDGIFDANENNKLLITNYFYIAQVMNELNNENEQLKSICQDHRDHAIDFKADCVRLEKENEKLKQQLFEARRDYLIETADISDKPYLDDEIEKERREIFGDVE